MLNACDFFHRTQESAEYTCTVVTHIGVWVKKKYNNNNNNNILCELLHFFLLAECVMAKFLCLFCVYCEINLNDKDIFDVFDK